MAMNANIEGTVFEIAPIAAAPQLVLNSPRSWEVGSYGVNTPSQTAASIVAVREMAARQDYNTRRYQSRLNDYISMVKDHTPLGPYWSAQGVGFFTRKTPNTISTLQNLIAARNFQPPEQKCEAIVATLQQATNRFSLFRSRSTEREYNFLLIEGRKALASKP